MGWTITILPGPRLKKLIMRLAMEELDGLHILLITRDTSDIDFVELLAKASALSYQASI
jgi:hypothetical protein